MTIIRLRSSNKHVALQNLSIHHTWKNIKKKTQYENNKLKLIVPTWNDESELNSASDIQDNIEYIIKKYKTLTAIPHTHVYIN